MNDFSSTLRELEKMRQSVFPKLLASYAMLGGGFLCFFLAGLSVTMVMVGFVVFIIGIVMMFAVAEPAKKEYALTYKNSIVTNVMSQKLDNVTYYPKYGFEKEYIGATGFMMLGNRYHSEDMISGSYKDVKFKRSDVLIEDHRSNGKSSYTVTYFKGRWMVFEFNKNFSRDLQIIQKGFGYTNKKKSIFTSATSRRHKIEFENVQFNNSFDCYGQDDQEAFYLITPQIQEALMNFKRAVDGEIMIGFKANMVNVAIENGKDMLEPSIFSPVSYENDILPILQERNVIQNFIDMLKIDRNIFKQ